MWMSLSSSFFLTTFFPHSDHFYQASIYWKKTLLDNPFLSRNAFERTLLIGWGWRYRWWWDKTILCHEFLVSSCNAPPHKRDYSVAGQRIKLHETVEQQHFLVLSRKGISRNLQLPYLKAKIRGTL